MAPPEKNISESTKHRSLVNTTSVNTTAGNRKQFNFDHCPKHDSMVNGCNFCENTNEGVVQLVESDSDRDNSILEIVAKYFWFSKCELKTFSICNLCRGKLLEFHQFYRQVQRLHPTDVTERNIELEPLIIKTEVDSSEDTDHRANDGAASTQPPPVTDEDIRLFCRLECPDCQRQFNTYALLRTHCLQFHNKCPTISCCTKRYQSLKKLKDHILMHINPTAFRCELCKTNLTSMVNLIRHQNVVHLPQGDKTFDCQLCPKKFSARYMLYDHMKYKHKRDKNIECPHCSKRFLNKKKLSDHIRCHQKQDPIICDVCSKAFTSKYSFDRHQLSHHGTKVDCPLCKKSLKNEQSLRKHLQRHRESEMDIKCDFCDKRSPTVNAMRLHVQTKHKFQERNYKCTICDKKFLRPSILKRHMTVHTVELLHNCEFCEKRFRSTSNLYAHRKKYHPEEFEKERMAKLAPKSD